jgi:tellurite resistance protein
MLTDEQRRWLGTAIAMADADVLDASEEAMINDICDSLQLGEEARSEVQKMIESPPSPVELASWAIMAKDRVGLYRTAVQMAAADGVTEEREDALLGCLSKVLHLSEKELAEIENE